MPLALDWIGAHLACLWGKLEALHHSLSILILHPQVGPGILPVGMLVLVEGFTWWCGFENST